MAFESLFAQYDRLVLFDTETTGLQYSRDEIIEFAAVVVELQDRISRLSAPVTTMTIFFAAMIVPIPMVKAALGTSSIESKKRLFASMVISVSFTSWVQSQIGRASCRERV